MYAPKEKATAATVAHLGALQRPINCKNNSTNVLFAQDQSTKISHNLINPTVHFRKTGAMHTRGGQRY